MKTQKEILQAATEVGLRKAALSSTPAQWGRLSVLSMLAGAFIALGGVLSVIIGFGFPEATSANPGLQRILSGLLFPVGLFLVVNFGAELFTGNNAVLMPPMLERRTGPAAVVLNWTLVWFGNFAGALLLTWLLVDQTGILAADPWRASICRVAETKASLGAWTCFTRGIGANWCVCLAVWLAIGAKTLGGKAIACWLPVMAFVALGYEHCVANMFFIPAGMMSGASVTIGALGRNLLFSTAGNIVGGALFVGCLYWWLHADRTRKK